MVQELAVPRADFLSHTLAGLPWVDFEWLTQLLYYGIHQAAGFPGLYLFKIALLVFGAWVLSRILALQGAGAFLQGLGALLWSMLLLPKTDLRPEGFSLVFFGLELWFLEALRLRSRRLSARDFVLAAGFFALWANLHLGFLYGLALLGLYGAGGGFKKGMAGLGLAALGGTLLNPYGYQVYLVAAEHLRFAEPLSRVVQEWRPLSFSNPWTWPFLVLWLFTAGLVLYGWARRRTPWTASQLLSLGLFGVAGVLHVRHAAYFTWVALPFVFVRLRRMVPETGLPPRGSALKLAALYGLLAFYWAWQVRPRVWPPAAYDDFLLPVQTERFLRLETSALSGLKMYNPWGWGGYLGYRLGENYKVFQDGRYIFHPLLAEAYYDAVNSPETWQAFLDRRGVDLALIENEPWMLSSRFVPSGTEVPRPYYVFYMPRERWALAWWDERALVFLRRSKAPKKWLARQEYRYFKPRDNEARALALRHGQIPPKRLQAEIARHAAELGHGHSH